MPRTYFGRARTRIAGARLRRRIPVFKLQEAAALWIPEVDIDTVAALERYADTIHLTQTTQRRGDELTRFLGIEDAVAARRADPRPCQWRTNFHAPVFLDDLGAFRTTRFAIEDALRVRATLAAATA